MANLTKNETIVPEVTGEVRTNTGTWKGIHDGGPLTPEQKKRYDENVGRPNVKAQKRLDARRKHYDDKQRGYAGYTRPGSMKK